MLTESDGCNLHIAADLRVWHRWRRHCSLTLVGLGTTLVQLFREIMSATTNRCLKHQNIQKHRKIVFALVYSLPAVHPLLKTLEMLPKAPGDSVANPDEKISRHMAKLDQECLNMIQATNGALSESNSDDKGGNEANLHCDILSGPGESRMFTEEESRWMFATQCTA